jgi:hypothetical protein
MRYDFLFSREEIDDLVMALYHAIRDGAASSREQEARWKLLQERFARCEEVENHEH